VSDVVYPVKKVSREGIVLIKSFEGFRPRAVARPEGGWIIGYGHTLSAREGASVSEADAELLLRYDLLPVEKRLNETAPAALNQHQFDALASFAFSVGLDRFETSDVLSRLTSGDDGAAAEAMLAWPETRSPSAGARRRAAERALFTADPARPVALAALLSAPVVEPEPAPHDPPVEAHDAPLAERQVAERIVEPQPAEIEPRAAAVAVLLGETETPVGPAAAPIVPTFETFTPAPVDREPTQDIASLEAVADTAIDFPSPETPIAVAPEPANDVDAAPEAADPTPTGLDPAPAGAMTPRHEPQPFTAGPVGGGAAASLALNAHRYSPYGAAIVGPLPGLAPFAGPKPEPEPEPTTALESLMLTSPDDAPEPVVVRPAWTAEERAEVETAPAGESLFGEDLGLTQGGQPLGQPDFEPQAPQRFDWSETGAFIVMGAVGLTAFGASMAAFRLASEQGAGDETSIIGWVLAVIGVACVGVSSFNLYRKFGLAGSDR
jgi:lysozyme